MKKATGKTDAVSMLHDDAYSVCGKKAKSEQIKCKNEADREMVHRWMRLLGKKDNGAMS